MSIQKQLIEENIDRIFIAYSNVYIDDAVKAVKESPKAEVVVIQPYEQGRKFSSTKKMLELYRKLGKTTGIPILFTPQGRGTETGQFFEYGSRLFDVIDIEGIEDEQRLDDNLRSGLWVLQAQDKLYSRKNLLMVKTPIKPIKEISNFDKLSVSICVNIFKHRYGEPVEAVAIPAPKLIIEDYGSILLDL